MTTPLQVAAALGSPLIVWAYQFQTRHGDGFDLHFTEQRARAQLLDQFDECHNGFDDEYGDILEERAGIEKGTSNSFNFGDDWYGIESREVLL